MKNFGFQFGRKPREAYGTNVVTFDIWNHTSQPYSYHFQDGPDATAYLHSPLAAGQRVSTVMPLAFWNNGDYSIIADGGSGQNIYIGSAPDSGSPFSPNPLRKVCLHVFDYGILVRGINFPAPLEIGIYKPVIAADVGDSAVGLNVISIAGWTPGVPIDANTPTEYRLFRSPDGDAFDTANAVQVATSVLDITNPISDTGAIAAIVPGQYYWYQVRAVTPFGIPVSTPIRVYSQMLL